MYSNVPGTQRPADDDARYGWGKRPYSWEFAVSGSARAHAGHFDVRRLLPALVRQLPGHRRPVHTAADYDAYSITQSLIPPAPASAGGATLPSDIYTERLLQPEDRHRGRLRTTSSAGSRRSFPAAARSTTGTDSTSASMPGSAARRDLPGRDSTGKQTTDNCDIVDPANAGKFGDRSPLVELLADPGRSPATFLRR